MELSSEGSVKRLVSSPHKYLCASKQYFDKALMRTGATPLLWTTNLMAPEAYVLSAAIDGWAKKERDEAVRARAAARLSQVSELWTKGWEPAVCYWLVTVGRRSLGNTLFVFVRVISWIILFYERKDRRTTRNAM